MKKALDPSIGFEKPGGAIRAADLSATLSALGNPSLPAEYEQFLLKFNGARPFRTSAPADRSMFWRIWWPPDSEACSVGHVAFRSRMLRVNGRTEEGNDLVIVNQVFIGRIPERSFVFGGAEGGSLFLFDLRPGRFGQVIYWERQYESPDKWTRNPYHNVGWVADDFNDFLNRIEVEPEDFEAWESALVPDSARDWNGFQG